MSLSAVKLVEAEPYVNKVNSFAVGLKIKLAFGGSKKRSAPAPVVPVREEPRVQEVPQDIKQAMITLSNTLFAFDKFNLTPAAATELDKVVKWLNENPTLNVVIEGHTDNMGAADYNQRLSEERAKSVYEYFVSHGVSASRLSYRGYGLTRPVATNATEAGRQQNRRVELIIK